MTIKSEQKMKSLLAVLVIVAMPEAVLAQSIMDIKPTILATAPIQPYSSAEVIAYLRDSYVNNGSNGFPNSRDKRYQALVTELGLGCDYVDTNAISSLMWGSYAFILHSNTEAEKGKNISSLQLTITSAAKNCNNSQAVQDNLVKFTDTLLAAIAKFPSEKEQIKAQEKGNQQAEQARRDREKNAMLQNCKGRYGISLELGNKLLNLGYGNVIELCQYATQLEKQNYSLSLSKGNLAPGESAIFKVSHKNGSTAVTLTRLKLQPDVIAPTEVTYDGKNYPVRNDADLNTVANLIGRLKG